MKSDIEVFVIDDKSTKNKKKYQDLQENKDFIFVTFLENTTTKKGAGVCRNIGLKKAQGRWILFADADDYFVVNMYSLVRPYFESDSDVIFLYPTSVYLDSGDKATRHARFVRRIENYKKNKTLKSELELRYRFEVPWSKMIQKSFLERHEIFFEEVMVSNDVLFSTKVGFYMKNFTISPHSIYIVTQGKETLTTQKSEKNFDIRLSEKEKYFYFLKTNLSINEFKVLNLSFMDLLLKSYTFGVKKFFWVFKTLIQKRLPFFDTRVLSLKFIYQKILK
jgi:glycosyltransferase involved in cell wall biosynthesis